MPKSHPARDTQDTFYINENVVLRTQTFFCSDKNNGKEKAAYQNHFHLAEFYRSDTVDATHSPLFHQIEGLVIDKGITMADLKGTLELLMKRLLRRGHSDKTSSAPFSIHRAFC